MQIGGDRLWGGVSPAGAAGVQGEGQQAGGAPYQGAGLCADHPVALPLWQRCTGPGAEQQRERGFPSCISAAGGGDCIRKIMLGKRNASTALQGLAAGIEHGGDSVGCRRGGGGAARCNHLQVKSRVWSLA